MKKQKKPYFIFSTTSARTQSRKWIDIESASIHNTPIATTSGKNEN